MNRKKIDKKGII